ncbi:hypothetical protein BBJ28_00004906 [Nothophytophthora sp. Chile5]|nr:hypothetical protein BBJ28_00004906 [Nothophytophthora sp. Chile5]
MMATAPTARAPACGEDGHVHAHAHDGAGEYDEESLAYDPTLASCCERDQRDFDKAMKLKAVLTAHDPTSAGVRTRQQLFQPPAPSPSTVNAQCAALPPQDSHADLLSDSDSDSDFDDSGDEFGMASMLAVRRKQLEQQFQQAARDAADGYGVVLEADLSQLLQELRMEPDVPRVALVVDGQTAESTAFVRVMRSEMAAVAQRYIGTKFCVVPTSPATSLHDDDSARQLRLNALPCMAAFRRGERVDSIALDAKMLATEPEVLWEARFLPWLAKCSVLNTERQATQGSRDGGSQASTRGGGDEDKTEHTGFDCGMEGCRLRFGYEHEHVGPSQEAKNEISAWRT